MASSTRTRAPVNNWHGPAVGDPLPHECGTGTEGALSVTGFYPHGISYLRASFNPSFSSFGLKELRVWQRPSKPYLHQTLKDVGFFWTLMLRGAQADPTSGAGLSSWARARAAVGTPPRSEPPPARKTLHACCWSMSSCLGACRRRAWYLQRGSGVWGRVLAEEGRRCGLGENI